MDLQQLIEEATPGSIWLRTDGSRARVIAITNLSLPAESQQKYVPVVVYVGPSGKVFSRPLKDFAGYFPTWIGHDSGAEAIINSLLTPINATKAAPVEASEDDSIDMSDDEPVAAPRAKPTVQVREKASAPALATVATTGDYNDLVNRPAPPPVLLKAAFQIGNDTSRKTPAVDADQLSRALRVYSQVPDEHLGLVVHKLSFELSPNLTIDSLKEAFAPDEWVNTVDAFRIGTPVSDETVGVDAYIGVYPEFTRNVLYGTVYVGVDMVPVAPLQSHAHETVSQQTTSAPEEVPPQDGHEASTVEAVRDAESEAVEVPASDPTEKASDAESAQVEAPDASAEESPQTTNTVAEVEKNQDAVVDKVSSESSEDAPVPPVKKKRRPGRPKKAVDPVLPPMPDDDTELDVENLS